MMFFADACTRVSVEIPSQDVIVKYSYPVFQEKFFTYTKTSQTLTIEFNSKSDLLVSALQTIDRLSSKLP